MWPQLRQRFQNFPDGRQHLGIFFKNMNIQVMSQSYESEFPERRVREAAQKILKSPGLDRCFPDLNEGENHLGIGLHCRFWFCSSGVGLESLCLNIFPCDVNAAGLRTYF